MRRSGSGNGAFWMAGVVSVVVLAVGIAWVSGRFSAPEGPEVPVPVVSSEGAGGSSMKAAQDVADAVPGSGASADGAAGSNEPGPLPRLDEVRHESDGLVVIAGRVAPFADIILRLDGLEFARASADGAGAFATVATLEPSTAARVLTLTQIKDGGGEILSPDELILTPVRSLAAAEQVAERGDTAETLAEPAVMFPNFRGYRSLRPTSDASQVSHFPLQSAVHNVQSPDSQGLPRLVVPRASFCFGAECITLSSLVA